MSCVTILRLMSSLRKASSQSSSAEILRRPASASGTLVGVVQVEDYLLEVGQREGVEDVELPLGVVADVAEWGTSYAVSFFIDSTSIALSSFAYIRMIITITHNHKQHPHPPHSPLYSYYYNVMLGKENANPNHAVRASKAKSN